MHDDRSWCGQAITAASEDGVDLAMGGEEVLRLGWGTVS